MGQNLFEQIKKVNNNGAEYWSARELMPLLGYEKWQKFSNATERAKESCRQVGQKVADHFTGAGKPIISGKNRSQTIDDFYLTRYACYLVAQNGDSRKVEIAKAQTYFAIKTRQQEVRENLIEDQKRVFLREDLKSKNKALVGAAKKAGVNNFGNFHDQGYMGLYGGLRQKDIKNRKGIKENILGQKETGDAHKLVVQKVRNTIKTLGGDMPENLPKFEDVKVAKKRLKSTKKEVNQNTKNKNVKLIGG